MANGFLPREPLFYPDNHPKRPQDMRKYSLCLITFSLTVLIAAILTPPRVISVSPKTPVLERLTGKNWAYAVPFPVHNKPIIEKLIQCESGGINIARPDSNGLISWGILQFNGTSTWNEMERRFNFYGSPLIPSDAIRMADLMISAGLLNRWTCARILNLAT